MPESVSGTKYFGIINHRRQKGEKGGYLWKY